MKRRILPFLIAALAVSIPAAHAAETSVNAPAAVRRADEAAGQQIAIFAGGCFWGVEGVFSHVRGVTSVLTGYHGGGRNDARYDEVSTGSTLHAEAVQITYDPAKVRYDQLLRVLFSVVADPTQLNRQGPDEGAHYRSALVPTTQTTAIINAGSSTLKGFEAEAGVTLFDSLKIDAAYAYLSTRIKKIVNLSTIVQGLGLPFTDIRGLPVGSPIPNAMPHKLSLSANYRLPLDDKMGKLSIGGTWIYQSKYRAVSDPTALVGGNLVFLSNYGVLPSSRLLNLNVNWENLGGLPVDASIFVTNVTKEKVFLHANVQAQNGFVSNIIGEPRMWGGRLRFKFGN